MDPDWFGCPGSGSVVGIRIRIRIEYNFNFLCLESMTRIRISMDPHLFDSLDSDPDPH
jgi:hypothetical protein